MHIACPPYTCAQGMPCTPIRPVYVGGVLCPDLAMHAYMSRVRVVSWPYRPHGLTDPEAYIHFGHSSMPL
jgi:hypothetical protein